VRGVLETRANALTALARDLQDARDQLATAHHDRTVCAQRLQEMEANYASLREEYYRIYYTLYPCVPPSPPGALTGAASGPAADAPGEDDASAASSSSSRFFD